jgi:cell division protease FtsH
MDSSQRKLQMAVFLVFVAGVVFALIYAEPTMQPKTIPYSELVTKIEAGGVAEVEIRSSEIRAVLREGDRNERVIAKRLPKMDERDLLATLWKHDVKVSGRDDDSSSWGALLLIWLLPMGVLAALYFVVTRRMAKRGPLSFGKSAAKIYDRTRDQKVTFDDVAGVDEAKHELAEVIDFLRDPDKYQALGARIPKGVLLVGPPGTGKTLLARAVAGEAEVPFFSMSGSEFVEMFVGVGAARMRSLFEQAKERAPCIVFLDELDAVGKSRAAAVAFGGHEEREQTLNQLLVEMDGFDPGKGVVIMAATNRPEVLDPALVRPGRFDRQVLVDRPDKNGRLAILGVHARKVKLGKVDLGILSQRTPGMVGADLANMVNEAALAAARRGSAHVEQEDFEEAIDRIQLGLKKSSLAMNEGEKRRVAYHESGHALVAMSVAHADPVHRVTIVPRSIGALGATLQLPTEDRYLMTRDELRDRICVMLGGRTAEEVVFGDVSTGAQNDLERASETARQMVCRFGMSEKLGPLTFGRTAGALHFGSVVLGDDRNFSEETARLIDHEIVAIVDAEHRRARSILEQRRDSLEALAERLLENETIGHEELMDIVGPRSSKEIEGRSPVPASA